MAGTQHTKEYRNVTKALVGLRSQRGVSQKDLAERLGKPPSYVAKVELCERRLDIVEFCIWLRALDIDPYAFIREHLTDLPRRIPEKPFE
ncbi:helix-turn-helix transcriptional regulator [Roseovarius sp. SK2]|uniref:helix-turn-helix domain-containing protein n=1 Tax=Roseovarius TaxID=74030 RepID=UPI00237C03E5|nr:helix-turn-helix transcriptional regulator [Roseovarius sp. SK2]MDD9727286.1 helix-turn-helix transcriptional regulator [Roseovarius sp. SK2]